MPAEVAQYVLKESLDSQMATTLLNFFYRTPGQPAFRLLREVRRYIVLAQDVIEIVGRGSIGFTYLVCGEGLMVTIDFPDMPQARHFLDTQDTARAIVRINPAITVDRLMISVRQELDAIATAAQSAKRRGS